MDTSTSKDEPPGSRGNERHAPEQEGSRSLPRPEHVEAHILCDSCTRLIANSRIIQEFMGTAEPEDAYTVWKRLRGGPRTELFPHSHALSAIVAAEASASCHLCSILWHKLPQAVVEHGRGFLDAKVDENRSVDHLPVTFVVVSPEPTKADSDDGDPGRRPWDARILLKRYRGNVKNICNCRFCVYLAWVWSWLERGLLTCLMRNQGPLYPAGTSGSAPFLSYSARSEESLATARCWLKDCLEGHSECRLRSAPPDRNSPSKLPTRLIYVGETQGQLTP